MNVIMPQLGETVLEGSVAKWHKKAGDRVVADEPLFEVETDKAMTEIPAAASGVVERILVEAGVVVKVGTPLAVIRSDHEVSAPVPVAAPELATVAASIPAAGRTAPRLSPVVRRLLGENGLQPGDIVGTGEAGRITRQDVLGYLEKLRSAPPAVAAPAPCAPAAPAREPAAADEIVVPLNRTRRLTAAHMVRSKATSPHTLQAVEASFHAVERARRECGAEWKVREGFSLTYLPFVARAVCLALARYPNINSRFADDQLFVNKRVHLGIAVDLGFQGLVVPVVRDGHGQNLRGLALQLHALADKARRGALTPDDSSGGTYTISNSGSFGTLISVPIIHQPQAAILSMDGVAKKAVVVEGPDGDAIVVRPMGVLAQCFDHRAFDGAYSAAFLRELKTILEGRDWLAELA
jgi:pyruvate dehydrogenase E2 component (dihydrolipoamide acetyltransferase)